MKQEKILIQENEDIIKDNTSEMISEIKKEESKNEKSEKSEENSISHQIGYLSQLKRNKQKQIEKLEEKELERNKLYRMKKVKKIFKNENEIKLGKIYTTLGQRKHIKYKTKSMHKENPININNKKDNFSEKGST